MNMYFIDFLWIFVVALIILIVQPTVETICAGGDEERGHIVHLVRVYVHASSVYGHAEIHFHFSRKKIINTVIYSICSISTHTIMLPSYTKTNNVCIRNFPNANWSYTVRSDLPYTYSTYIAPEWATTTMAHKLIWNYIQKTHMAKTSNEKPYEFLLNKQRHCRNGQVTMKER